MQGEEGNQIRPMSRSHPQKVVSNVHVCRRRLTNALCLRLAMGFIIGQLVRSRFSSSGVKTLSARTCGWASPPKPRSLGLQGYDKELFDCLDHLGMRLRVVGDRDSTLDARIARVGERLLRLAVHDATTWHLL